MTPALKIKIDPALIPDEPGCLSVLHGIAEGEALQAWGNVPKKLKGEKWPDVYSWTVFFWEGGRIWLHSGSLKTESPSPLRLDSVRRNFCHYNYLWEELK